MNLLNFAHPLPATTCAAIAAAAGAPLATIIEMQPQLDTDGAFAPQIAALLERTGISSEYFQTEPWLVVLPALNYIAALILAELHGRLGHFPAIIRLRPVANGPVTHYEFAEIIDLDHVRQHARTRR